MVNETEQKQSRTYNAGDKVEFKIDDSNIKQNDKSKKSSSSGIGWKTYALGGLLAVGTFLSSYVKWENAGELTTGLFKSIKLPHFSDKFGLFGKQGDGGQNIKVTENAEETKKLAEANKFAGKINKYLDSQKNNSTNDLSLNQLNEALKINDIYKNPLHALDEVNRVLGNKITVHNFSKEQQEILESLEFKGGYKFIDENDGEKEFVYTIDSKKFLENLHTANKNIVSSIGERNNVFIESYVDKKAESLTKEIINDISTYGNINANFINFKWISSGYISEDLINKLNDKLSGNEKYNLSARQNDKGEFEIKLDAPKIKLPSVKIEQKDVGQQGAGVEFKFGKN